jgi:pimeloyl-ACP methyl ester carboxylesterase
VGESTAGRARHSAISSADSRSAFLVSHDPRADHCPLRSANSPHDQSERQNGAVRVSSSHHVSVSIQEFGGHGEPLLFAHATGFHGYCYLPIADELTDRFTAYGLDFRGHGDTARPDDWQVTWDGYGDDALAAARAIAPDRGLVGFGHSMGATGLLMAAHRDPELFDVIVAFEPIVFPGPGDGFHRDPPPIIEGARRRRQSFGSFDEAIANYSSKSPMMAFDPEVLRLYVGHGFRPAPEGIRLKCDPEHEARTFENGALHGSWGLLPEIETQVVIVAGASDGTGPGFIAEQVADRLPNATYIENLDWDHFAPFVDPAAMATLITNAVG